MKLFFTFLCTAWMSLFLSAETIEREFQIKGHPSLILSNISGDITIEQGKTHTIAIEADNPNPEVEILFEQKGDRVTVETKYPKNNTGIRKGVEFRVQVPNYCDLKINSVSGDVKLSHVEGRIYLNTVSGDLDMEETGGHLKLNSVSGDIMIKGLDNCDLEANSVSGDLVLTKARLESGVYEFNTTSGDIEIWHGQGASYRISGQAISGSMSNETNGDIVIKKAKYGGKRSIDGSYGSGKAEVDINTISGDLTVGVQ
ncbi:MAG: hypothetical protein CR997_11395 [Acidobacteria bacterium]|nr:MAG: hypothetical protein CR997_11395 [Acidobacteriota bacterium]